MMRIWGTLSAMRQTTALVVCGAEHPGPGVAGRLRQMADFVVAADGGYDNALAMGLAVDALVGDMDSLRAPPPQGPGVAVVRWPRDKDWTDTELAIAWARGRGAGRIFLLGGGGGRLDHALAIYALFQRDDPPDRWYTGRDELVLIRGRARAALARGSQLSFFPAGAGECRAATAGLRWPLDGLSWRWGDCGVSNEMAGDELEVDVRAGAFLLARGLADGGEPFGPEF